MLLCAILMISSSLYLLKKAHEVYEMNNSEFILGKKDLEKDILDKYIDARLEGKKIKTDILGEYIDTRIAFVRLETGLYIKVIFPTILGAFLLGLTIAKWKQHERYKLLTKVLKTLIPKNIDDKKII